MQVVNAHGAKIPAVGLGTWQLRGTECVAAVAAGIGIGYRHIDTAAGMGYENEEAVGEGIRASNVPRSQLFITTKVARDDLGEADFERSVENSLKRLSFTYIDLVLVHWPRRDLTGAEMVKPLNTAWRRGLTRHIGVSNFTIKQLNEAWAATEAPIVANQCEYHPYLDQHRLMAACRARGTAFVAYCPLGRGIAFDDPVIAEFASELNRTPAQIILRWHIEQGTIPIPKSSQTSRLRENFDVFDFSLGQEQVEAISALMDTHHERIALFQTSRRIGTAKNLSEIFAS